MKKLSQSQVLKTKTQDTSSHWCNPFQCRLPTPPLWTLTTHPTGKYATGFSFRTFSFNGPLSMTPGWAGTRKVQEAQLSPRDRAMRRVNWNLANCHATVQKLLIRQVLTKSMVWSWRFSRRQCVIDNVHSTMTRPSRFHCLRCVINKPTTDDLWISPVYRRLAVAKFSRSTI